MDLLKLGCPGLHAVKVPVTVGFRLDTSQSIQILTNIQNLNLKSKPFNLDLTLTDVLTALQGILMQFVLVSLFIRSKNLIIKDETINV